MKSLVGIGLDFHDSGRESLASFYKILRDKISHASIVGLTSDDDARHFKECIFGIPTIHHLSNVGPANPQGINWHKFSLQNRLSKLIDAHWCNEDLGAWNFGPYNIPYFTPPLFEEDVAQTIADRIRTLQTKSYVPFLPEIPSCSFVVGRMSMGDFFHAIIEKTNCKFVLDLAHVFSYALFTEKNPTRILRSLPLHAVRHIHIAGGRPSSLNPWAYLDSHDDPILPEVIHLLGEAITECKNAEAVTFEIGAGISDKSVLFELERLNKFLEDVKFEPLI